LKLKCDEPLSNADFDFNLRRYFKKAWQTEKSMLIVRAKEIAAAGEERHRESVRKAGAHTRSRQSST